MPVAAVLNRPPPWLALFSPSPSPQAQIASVVAVSDELLPHVPNYRQHTRPLPCVAAAVSRQRPHFEPSAAVAPKPPPRQVVVTVLPSRRRPQVTSRRLALLGTRKESRVSMGKKAITAMTRICRHRHNPPL